jgi:hypothetical protein
VQNKNILSTLDFIKKIYLRLFAHSMVGKVNISEFFFSTVKLEQNFVAQRLFIPKHCLTFRNWDLGH